MTQHVFLFLFFLMLCIVHLWHCDWPHYSSPRLRRGAAHALVQRLLKPCTPGDCPSVASPAHSHRV
jgi:hypothetical protein